jgi:hypothetical protein
MNPKDLKLKIKDLLVLKNEDGTYDLFGSYHIIQQDINNYVVFTQEDKFYFSSLKNAVTWCVFDKNKKYKEVKRIAELDNLLGSLDVSILQHKKLVNKTDTEDKYIYLAKLNEDKLKKKAAISELSEYINLSKHWQTKKFTENQDLR